MTTSRPVDHVLVASEAQRSGIAPDKAEAAIRALVAFIEAKLASGETVVAAGAGEIHNRAARGGRAPL